MSKWRTKPYLAADAIRADAVTGCLKTIGDRVSVWRCENDPKDVDEVFLALATGSKSSSFETMDIVVLPENELADAGLVAESSEGDTAVEDLKERHFDLAYLDLDKLAGLARIVASRVKSSQVVRRTERQIKDLVRQAVSAGRVRRDELNEELGQKLSKAPTSH